MTSPTNRPPVFAAACLSFWLVLSGIATAQTVFLDFNTVGQYTNNFNPWNDAGGVNGFNYSFMESNTVGAGSSGGVSVFQSTDTTATYNGGSWDFSTNGATLTVSLLMKANGQTSVDKAQLGILNVNNNGLNNNNGVAFESFRFIPSSSTVWSLREQYRTGNANPVETTLGSVTVAAGRWYKFVVSLTNTSPGSFNSACALYDYGGDGLTPGPNAITFPTLQSRTSQDIALAAAVWPALRAFQDGGIDAWDNFLVYTPGSPPVITFGLANTAVATGQSAGFRVLADSPGTITYSWYTNGALVAGASAATYMTPPVNSAYSNVMVVVANANGATSNSAAISTFSPPPAGSMTPVAVNGFNRDIVIESNAAGPPFTSAAQEFNPGENTAFYQHGLPGESYGLPASGSFSSAVGDGTVFQFQPFTSSNALVMDSETGLGTGTLILATPATYSRIAVIANSGSGGGTPNLTLHFNDGSSFVTNYDAQDWFFNPGFALQGVDRINLATGSADGGPTDPRFYQTTVDIAGTLGAANNKPLTSLSFDKAAAANATAVYAVSGLPASAIGLPAVVDLPASNVLASSATLSGQVTATGGDAPSVTIYYGPANGGTNAGAWASSAALGSQSGVFGISVGGLSGNTTYYFTAKAQNSGGIAWAAPSLSFQTPTPMPPSLVNLPATNVQATLATLNGQILSTGGDVPVVTVYYGPTDGGTNPGAWAQTVALGPQSGVFAQTVTGLSSNTAYYFAARAVNGAGAAWASPSQGFTTHSVNSPANSVSVLTHHNDSARTGANLNETALNVFNVNTNQFGLLYSRPVDDQIYAQPLVAGGVNFLGKGTHNLVIVATVNDSVYAFDADDPTVTAPYWQASFLGPNAMAPRNSDMTGACGGNYLDFSGKLGIVGTPVIDAASGTLYVVGRTKENGTTFVQRLHALDITSGAERPNSPVVITANYPGTGDGNLSGVITFDPQRQNQRPGLALVNGVVYISWASHCDWGPYHGWVIGYDAASLQRVVVYNDSPNGYDAGIWMSGQAPSADASGNLYISTGNGSIGDGGDPRNTINRGESFLKLTRNGTNFTVASWFTPYNYQALENGDIDLGSAGVLLIPGTTLAFSGGKQGVLYLVNRDNMGGLSSSTTADTNVIQTFQASSGEIHGGPIWWDGPGGSFGYVWPVAAFLQQYQLNKGTGKFNLPAFAQSPTAAPGGQPGGILALSANGTNAGSGIVWASLNLTGDANQSVQPGILHAYNAQNVGLELWNSEQLSARDGVGNFAKFVPPTVANGKVYLATFSNRLNVYGLFPHPTLTVTLSGGNALLSWPANFAAGYLPQSSTNLASGVWAPVGGSIGQSNGLYQIAVPMNGARTFYRLKK
jgi:hypothetical protein